MYRVVINVSLKTNGKNKYAYALTVHGHACRTVCSVCAYGARVAHPFPSTLYFFVFEVFIGAVEANKALKRLEKNELQTFYQHLETSGVFPQCY